MEQELFKEYKLIYETYESYNEQFLILKGWSVTVGLAALIAAYTKPVSSAGRIGVVIAALSAIPFWLTETFWKLFQKAYLPRLEKLEHCADTGSADCPPMQGVSSWQNSFDQYGLASWLDIAFLPHVILPHGAVFLLGLALAIKWPPTPDHRSA